MLLLLCVGGGWYGGGFGRICTICVSKRCGNSVHHKWKIVNEHTEEGRKRIKGPTSLTMVPPVSLFRAFTSLHSCSKAYIIIPNCIVRVFGWFAWQFRFHRKWKVYNDKLLGFWAVFLIFHFFPPRCSALRLLLLLYFDFLYPFLLFLYFVTWYLTKSHRAWIQKNCMMKQKHIKHIFG